MVARHGLALSLRRSGSHSAALVSITQENLALFDFELDAGDMAKLEAINLQPRYERSVTGPDA
tara:strand:- start:232 stop:420 length:189 start_codon:yes stop_codon:yes gene_type:complete